MELLTGTIRIRSSSEKFAFHEVDVIEIEGAVQVRFFSRLTKDSSSVVEDLADAVLVKWLSVHTLVIVELLLVYRNVDLVEGFLLFVQRE